MSSQKIRASGPLIGAARQYLGITQARLAKLSDVAEKTIVTFEKERTVPHESTRERIQGVLEARGIVFTNGERPGFYFDKTKVIFPA